jgi:N-acetylglucosamine-6-sulfatase
MLAGVDESLGGLLHWLDQSGELDRTLIVVTSDHGYWYGEHGLSVERRLAYEEGIRIPLLMRLPAVISPHSEPSQLALTLDLAPTLLNIAGAAPLPVTQGRSLLPVLRGEAGEWRDDFLIEHFSDNVFPRTAGLGYQAIRSTTHKLIHYTDLTGIDELYNLESDRYEMENLVNDPSAQAKLIEMRARLERLLNSSGYKNVNGLPPKG